MKNKWWSVAFGIAGVLLAISFVFRLANRDFLYAFLDFMFLIMVGLVILWQHSDES